MCPHDKMAYKEQSCGFTGPHFKQGTTHMLCLLVGQRKKKWKNLPRRKSASSKDKIYMKYGYNKIIYIL